MGHFRGKGYSKIIACPHVAINENYVYRDALFQQSTECSEVQEVSHTQSQLNGFMVETPSHHDLHRELPVSTTKRGLLPGEKPELKQVLEQRRLEQHREQPPLELETEVRKRQQMQYEQEGEPLSLYA